MSHFLTYTTLGGDTYDMIALDYYNDEFKAPLIQYANPELAGVLIFEAGVRLRVPMITKAAAAGLPPWKRSDAR